MPRAAAKAMLSTLTSNNQPALFLEPCWGAHIREALHLLQPQQPLLVVVTDPSDLWHMFHCEDFSIDLSAGRLWLLTGCEWPTDLQNLLQQTDALPTPSIFIRTTAVAESLTNAMMDHARRVLSAEVNRRHEQMARVIQQPPRPVNRDDVRIVLAGPSQYRLWDDAGRMLSEALVMARDHAISPLNNSSQFTSSQAAEKVAADPLDPSCEQVQLVAFNTDHPATSSPLGLARTIEQADAVLSAGTGRSDLPPVAPLHKPWLTWISSGRIPSPVPGSTHDRLLLADANWLAAAQAAGWGIDQLEVVGWPATAALSGTDTLYSRDASGASERRSSASSQGRDASAAPALAILVDLPESIEAPDYNLSSHTLLWEAIAYELGRDPLAVGDDPMKFLHRHRENRKVSVDGLDVARFVEQLILPAYVLGLARGLAAAKIPLHLHGRNWDRFADLAHLWRGNLDTSDQFIAAIEQAGALVHPWPVSGPHSIAARGRLILHPTSRRMETWVREAKELLARAADGKTISQTSILTFTRQSLLAQLREIVSA